MAIRDKILERLNETMNQAMHTKDGHFWVGTVNNIEGTGEWIEAANMKSAKYFYTLKHKLPANSGYVIGKKKGFKP